MYEKEDIPVVNGYAVPGWDMAQVLRERVGLISGPQFAAMMMVSEFTTQQWRVAGTGPQFVKLGRTVFYRLEDIQAWMASNTHKSTETSVFAQARLAVAAAVEERQVEDMSEAQPS